MSFYKWMVRRECGYKPQVGDQNFLMQRMYSSIEPYYHWSDANAKINPISDHGAVFNLEFSPEGNILVAACEKKSILIFDSTTTKKVNEITNAHTDSVNCIRFLDSRLFATCSDDTTIALWDLRNLKVKIRSLNGHSNWVKNIEYSHKDNLLVTSAFDGSIFTWDINSHTEQGLIYQNVFHTSGLMRCRISPDGTKLVICTTGGYLMIIHDLDLLTLQKDLGGFRPSIYRLMQVGQQYIPQAAKFDHVFSKSQKKNRVELVTDFPENNDAEVVMSLQMHPHGHSFLSRNISYDESTEWSCVHSIRDEPGDITDQLTLPLIKRKRKYTSDGENEQEQLDSTTDNAATEGYVDENPIRSRNRRIRIQQSSIPGEPQTPPINVQAPVQFQPESFVPDIWAAEVTVQERAIRQTRARSSNSVNGYNFVYAISSGVLPAFSPITAVLPFSSRVILNAREQRSSSPSYPSNNGSDGSINISSSVSISSSSSGSSNSSRGTSSSSSLRSAQSKPPQQFKSDRKIFKNAKKLMYYIQESTHGKGYIKEPCYSADGRIISSPYENGVRLLAYKTDCSEYPLYEVDFINQRQPQELVLIKNMSVSNKKDIVLTAKFSPCEPLLVSGCHSGKIAWYHPNF